MAELRLRARTNRALSGVMVLMCALCGLFLCVALQTERTASVWLEEAKTQASLIIPAYVSGAPDVSGAPQDTAAQAEVARAYTRAYPGIVEARQLSKAERALLLAPFLRDTKTQTPLPLPHIIALRFDAQAPPDWQTLRSELARIAPDATLDDHAHWRADIESAAWRVRIAVFMACAIAFAAMAGALTLAARAEMAANREVIDVLHISGAQDSFIARMFQAHFFRRGIAAGSIGTLIGALGAALFTLADLIPQAESSFSPNLAAGIVWRNYDILILLVIPLGAGLLARRSARRALFSFLRAPV